MIQYRFISQCAVKGEFVSKNYQVISDSKLRLRFSMTVATPTVEIEVPVVHATHDGQDLQHPLIKTRLFPMCVFFFPVVESQMFNVSKQ